MCFPSAISVEDCLVMEGDEMEKGKELNSFERDENKHIKLLGF